jgi:putative mRNA 3-end processing factor
MSPENLIVPTPSGLYCALGGFHIDPKRPVKQAVITHAHADHARPGSRHYLAAEPGAEVLRLRLGADIALQTLAYGEEIDCNGVRLSLHPAGHVLGSAMVRLEHRGRVWVVTGDFKDRHDPTCQPFQPVSCHVLITESTFGLPVFRWPPQRTLLADIDSWWKENRQAGRASVLYAYSFGKAQRVLAGLDRSNGPIYTHAAVEAVTHCYRNVGIELPPTRALGNGESRAELTGAMVIAPPAARGSSLTRRLPRPSTAFASGWMQIRGNRRRQSLNRGFVLSDHADWPGLLGAIAEMDPETVFVTHGYAEELVRFLNETGRTANVWPEPIGRTLEDGE